MEPHQAFLLIDENLSPQLVRLAAMRGFRAVHVNDVNLATRDDKHITRYAIQRDMIVVTRNVADFEDLYRQRKLHPGLVFLVGLQADNLMRSEQATLFAMALDQIINSEPIQEVISVRKIGESEKGIDADILRYELPPHA